MNDFIFYFKMGLFHVLDIKAYDHILFLIVLAIVYQFKQWKKVLWLITLFTVGHSITLALSAYGILKVNADLVEFLIPLSIFITGLLNVLTAKKASVGKENQNLFFAVFFGLIHGLGFSNYFKIMIGKTSDKLIPLLEFAGGVEMAQIIIVLAILGIGILTKSVFKVQRRDWILVISSIVMGVSFQMMINRIFW
ncbi:HupE/UreJ family protein [Tenacibaculum finnmarkense genomovar finnmarkense]|uniref:HupE/UreJ family protein n=2 Tax=Tenacibaculum finnmarkense TaxID=2781243 RepID=UPI00187B22D8|nr:HupE/UreJ family protein [Tenacibaculum finnmarkense]MBE7644834.1 HupE/UreJ family protein [Tenacibaculum finnmarkense genomovar ulcerans]MBE7691786.1 HupE/UreJ family protein [Tenacibaculum finnmarkense genomovar finnmarkense]MCD8411409.1 HupE/UreJ family protein [Tenacibaculum finnmarkense genomovar ulcerans]MCD8416205.1 HupE/UreJ family protein [Tenacibaculum finnmarkense genomovar finnmarkense]MCD8446224.1 HupE/UreJ family protein [Tenacibaculum finnmarkense genomovar finnmarkense]